MAFVQQTKEQTYKFARSQRECSFMLMYSDLSIFLAIECPILRTVSYTITSSFYDVITQISVASHDHVFGFGYEGSRVGIVLNDTTVFCESVGIVKGFNRPHFS